MAQVDWRDTLGWGKEQLQDLRSVGFDFLRQGHYQRAIVYFEALVALDPDSVYDNMTLGALYVQVGEFSRALERLERALTLDPTNLSAQINKAKALLVTGKQAEGIALARQLTTCDDPKVRDLSEALLMAYA